MSVAFTITIKDTCINLAIVWQDLCCQMRRILLSPLSGVELDAVTNHILMEHQIFLNHILI